MELFKMQFFDFLRFNFFNKKIKRKNGAKLLPMKKSALLLAKKAKVILSGNLKLNANCKTRNNGRSTVCRVDNGAELRAGKNGKSFQLFYGCDVIVFSGGLLELGSGFCNSDTKIRCKNHISIGEGAVISHNVTIEDYDGHQLYNVDADGNREAVAISAPITIGDHVKIGAGAIVLKPVPDNCTVVGNPGRIVRRRKPAPEIDLDHVDLPDPDAEEKLRALLE